MILVTTNYPFQGRKCHRRNMSHHPSMHALTSSTLIVMDGMWCNTWRYGWDRTQSDDESQVHGTQLGRFDGDILHYVI
jgi:hypothetical protein